MKVSFYENFCKTGLPILQCTHDKKELNFILDSGSDISSLESECSNKIGTITTGKKTVAIGVEGIEQSVAIHNIDFNVNDKTFEIPVVIHNLKSAFTCFEEQTGVKVHGLLGCDFMAKYHINLDFKNFEINIKDDLSSNSPEDTV